MKDRSHFTSTGIDHITGEIRSTETWQFPWEKGSVLVHRLKAEGTPDDHDELVVSVVADVADATWTWLWSSDPEYPFFTPDPNNERIFNHLPNDICDLIESETELDMTEARP